LKSTANTLLKVTLCWKWKSPKLYKRRISLNLSTVGEFTIHVIKVTYKLLSNSKYYKYLSLQYKLLSNSKYYKRNGRKNDFIKVYEKFWKYYTGTSKILVFNN
jgi:hypothetical protein